MRLNPLYARFVDIKQLVKNIIYNNFSLSTNERKSKETNKISKNGF